MTKNHQLITNKMVDLIIIIGYILFFGCALLVIGFFIRQLKEQPKLRKPAGIVAGLFLALFLISWVISGNEVTDVYAKFEVDAAESKLIGGVIIMMYILTFFAIIGIFYSEFIARFFKK